MCCIVKPIHQTNEVSFARHIRLFWNIEYMSCKRDLYCKAYPSDKWGLHTRHNEYIYTHALSPLRPPHVYVFFVSCLCLFGLMYMSLWSHVYVSFVSYVCLFCLMHRSFSFYCIAPLCSIVYSLWITFCLMFMSLLSHMYVSFLSCIGLFGSNV